MADDKKVQIAFEAKLDEITGALNQLGNDFKKFGHDAEKSFDGASHAVGHLAEELKKLVVAFISFEAIKEAIDTTKELGLEAYKLASIFGMSATEASQFAVAIKDVHGSVGQVEHAAAFLSRQLRENEDTLKRFGVVTRDDVNGTLLKQKELFMNAVAAVNEYKAGTDRNVASVAVFGRGALEMQEIMRLTPKALEEARIKADALGLTLSGQGLAAVLEFRDAQHEVSEVFEALAKVVGEALMPVLSHLGAWFAGMGPQLVQSFSVIVKTLVSVLIGLVAAFRLVAEGASGFIQIIAVAAISMADAFDKIFNPLHFNPKGALDALNRGGEQIVDIMRKTGANARKAIGDVAHEWQELWSPDTTPASAGGGGKSAPTHDKTLMARLEAQLAEKRSMFEREGAAQGQFEKFSLESERDYWAKYVNDGRLNTEERLKLRIKVADLETKIAQRQFATTIASLHADEAAYKSNLEAKLALQQQAQSLMERAYPNGGPEVEAERRKTEALMREIKDRNTKIAEETLKANADLRLKQLDAEKSILDARFQLREVSRMQQINGEKQLEDQMFDVRRDALNRELEMESKKSDIDLARVASLMNQRELMEQDHQNRILEIDKQASIEASKYVVQGQNDVQSAMSSMLEGIGKNIKNLGDAIKSFTTSVGAALQRLAAQRVAEAVLGPGTAGGDLVGGILKTIGLGGIGGGGKPAGNASSLGLGEPGDLGISLPSFDVGTPYVPQDMIAQIHKGERILTAAENRGGAGMSVTQNFYLNTPANARTQSQVAAEAARGLQRAIQRNG